MNLRANEKTKKYPFLFSNGDEDVKRFFFPIVVTTDGTLHKSAYDFINCVTSQTNLLQDADAADKIAVSLKSKILGYVTSRCLTKLHPVKAHSSSTDTPNYSNRVLFIPRKRMLSKGNHDNPDVIRKHIMFTDAYDSRCSFHLAQVSGDFR
jgi:hypothetical protein